LAIRFDHCGIGMCQPHSHCYRLAPHAPQARGPICVRQS
jgi:hypothetical protein